MERYEENSIIEKVHLLLPLGEAWYEKNGELYLLSVDEEEPKRCRAGDIGLLHDINPYSDVKENLTLKQIRKELQRGYRANTALSFALDGLDPTLEEVRKEVINRANELCQDSEIREFVRDRLLGCPVPKEADVKGAIEIAKQENASFLLGIFSQLSFKRPKKVFIDFANEDKAMLPQLERKLENEGIKSITSTPQNDDPTETFNQLDHALDDCDEIIVFYQWAPLGWLMLRLRFYRKAQARRKDKLTVCIRSPNNQPQGIKLPPNVRWETTLIARS